MGFLFLSNWALTTGLRDFRKGFLKCIGRAGNDRTMLLEAIAFQSIIEVEIGKPIIVQFYLYQH